MNPSPMVDQVNRMVGNILTWSGEVALPGVGSLFVEWRAARRISKRVVAPPSRVVSFTSQMRGALLTEEIARVAQCDAAEAQDIYDRWLVRVLQDQVLTIEGVGVLKFKNFTLDQAFDLLLNPQGHEPIRVRSTYRFDWVLWFGAAVIVCVVAAGISLWVSDRSHNRPWLNMDEPKQQVDAVSKGVEQINIDGTQSANTQGEIAESVNSEHTSVEVVGEGTKPTTEAAPAPVSAVEKPVVPPVESAAKSTTNHSSVDNSESISEFVSGRRYVVLGVFSTEQNGRRAVVEAAKNGGLTNCLIFKFGNGKWMVSPFNSTSSDECSSFIAQNGENFPGMWSYVAK